MVLKLAVLTNDLQFAAANKNQQRRHAVDRVLPRLCKFLSACRSLDIMIIHLQLVVPKGDIRSVGLPEELCFEEGSKGSLMLPEVVGEGDIVLQKPKDSGFFRTNLDDILRDHGVNGVILLGMQAQICIQTTAADAYFREYKVIVPSDGILSTSQDDVELALAWMRNYCAEIVTLNEIELRLRNFADVVT